MYNIKFKANNNIFTYTSHSFTTEQEVLQYFFSEYVKKYFNNDTIEIIKVKKIA